VGGPLHLDWIDYAEALLGGGAIDWSSPTAVSGLINKAQSLLPSDLVILPVDRMALALANPAILAVKPRGAQPLRAMLANDDIRASLVETVSMISVPALALGLGAPGKLAVLTSTKAGVPQPEVDEDLVDDAAVYIANFLRVFASSNLTGVIIADDGVEQFRPLLAPIEKVAAAYGWRFAVGPVWPEFETIQISVESKPEAVLAQVRALRS
jgi:hypothetical protein